MADQNIDWSKAVPFDQPQSQSTPEPVAGAAAPVPIDWNKAVPFETSPTSQSPAQQATPSIGAASPQELNEQQLREEIQASSGQVAGEEPLPGEHFVMGALKGLADTGHLVGAAANKLVNKVSGGRVPQVMNFETPESLKAHGWQETTGKVGEGVAEFFLTDGALAGLSSAEKFEKVAKVLKVLDESPNLMKAIHIGMSALRMGTVGAAQSVEQQLKGGGPVDLNLAMHEGAATGLLGGSLHGLSELARMPGASSAIRAAARAGQAALSIPTTLEQAKAAITPRQPDETEAQYEERVVMSGINATLGALGMKDLATSPEVAAGAGKVAEKTAGAASTGVEIAKGAGSLAADIGRAGKEFGKKQIEKIAIAGAEPEKLLTEATRPYISERDFNENVGRTLPYLVQENKSKPIQSLEDLTDAAHSAKQKLWQSKLSTPHPDAYIDGNAIAQKIKDSISDTTRRHFADKADAIEKWADTFKGEYPLDEALGAISQLNADLHNFYKLEPSEQWRAASADPKLSMLQDAADALRDSSFKKLEDLGEKNIPELRKDYGALNQLQRVGEKRTKIYNRQAPIDLKQSIGAMMAVAGGHPAAAAIPIITKFLNSPEYLITRAISKAGKASPKAEAGAEPATMTLKAQSFDTPYMEQTPQGFDAKAVLNHELGHAAVAHKVGFDPMYIVSDKHAASQPTASAPGKTWAQSVIDTGLALNKRADGTIPVEDLSKKLHAVLTMTMAGAAANELYDNIPRENNQILEGDKKFAHDMLDLLDVPADLHDFYMDRAFERAKSLLQDEHTSNLINEFSDTREKGLPETHHYSAWRMHEFKDRLGEPDDRNTQGITASGFEHPAGSEAVGEKTVTPGVIAGAGSSGGETGLSPSGLAAAERSVPAERTTGNDEYDRAIKEGGAIPGGLEKGDPEIGIPDMALFHDPANGSTMYVATHDLSIAKVKEELLKNRLAFEGRKKNVGEKAAKIEQGRITGRPEWVQASLEREKSRAKDILRNPQATDEEKKYAEQVLESSRTLQEQPALANLEARSK